MDALHVVDMHCYEYDFTHFRFVLECPCVPLVWFRCVTDCRNLCDAVCYISAESSLEEVPEEVWQAAEHLTKLDLSGNKLTQLPADKLGHCRNLRSLSLSDNKLTEWPLPSGGGLQEMEELFSESSIVLGLQRWIQKRSLQALPQVGNLAQRSRERMRKQIQKTSIRNRQISCCFLTRAFLLYIWEASFANK